MPLSNSRSSSACLGRVTRRWLAGLGVGLHVGVGLGLAPGAALAAPRGGEVLNGNATVTQDGKHTLIETSSRRTRMRWDGFDIAADESVHAQQPNAGSVLVNQVDDASITRIDGSLTSNGKVWILNPAGIYFGGSAIVEVAGLVAAAGELSDQAFVVGQQHFTNLRGEVRNQGRIVSDDGGVALIGRSVANQGQIVTRGGDLVMAAGDDVLIWRHDTHIQVRVPDLDSAANVENSGIIDTQGGRARLAAGDFLGLAIRNTGEIHARQIELAAGAESVVEVSGQLDARNGDPGGTGGHIEVSGDWIQVDDAVLDASGSTAGGEIWIGGEVGGGGTLPTARGTFVGPDAEIRANAIRDGDGGEVVLWSDEIAQVQGLVAAKGGRDGGDGGFIETSSKGRIDVAADIRVDGPKGRPGTWLLDPLNVAIVAALPDPLGDNLELLQFDSDLGSINFQPDGPPAGSGESLLVVDTLEKALRRGSFVIVSTQSLDAASPGDDLGQIEVRDEIVIESGDPVAPGTESTLQLLASDDVLVSARIASEEPDLRLNVFLQANDNQAVRAGGQPEAAANQRDGDVHIDAPIETLGGTLDARGTNLFVNADIDTRTESPSSSDPGGSVTLIASDPVAFGQIAGSDDETGDAGVYGNVDVAAGVQINTGGGSFLSAGDLFRMGSGAKIDAFVAADPQDENSFDVGTVQLLQRDRVTIDGDLTAATLLLNAGSTGVGDLLLGSNATLSATTLQLTAGDGTPASDNDVVAQVLIDPGTSFNGPDEMGVPESFSITQDAAITDANVPNADQFDAVDGVAGIFYTLTTLDGAPDGSPDIDLGDAAKFAGSDLVLAAPDSINLSAPLAPANLAIAIDGAFEVSAALAAQLQPLADPDPGDGEDDGFLRIQAGRSGEGSLTFESGAKLVADRIALEVLSGEEFFVDPAGATFESPTPANPLLSFELQQRGDITDVQDPEGVVPAIPALSQFTAGVAGVDYALLSQAGAITITDATRVTGTALTLTALNGIDTVPISVERADLGGFDGFLVTQELLNAVSIVPTSGPRILTLRAGTGTLSFQSTENVAADGDPPDIQEFQTQVEADRIHLVGATVDVTSGRPLFQSDAATSPDRLIFEQDGLITDSVVPSEENFPDGLGPSGMFVLQSNVTGINLSQDPDVLVGSSLRGWRFPVQDDTEVFLVAPGITLERNDGFDLVLGENDTLYGTDVLLRAVYDPPTPPPGEQPPPNPIASAIVELSPNTSILGFEPDLDFTQDMPDTPEDGSNFLTLDQEGDFNLRTAQVRRAGEPATTFTLPALSVQPDSYSLHTSQGSIEIDNALLGGTNLILQVDDPEGGEFIDFEFPGVLQVDSLTARMGGDFVVGSVASGMPGAAVDAGPKGTITLESGVIGEGSLSFAPGVDLTAETLFLTGGSLIAANPDSIVDARANAPSFDVDRFDILQVADLRNGLETADGLDLSTLPMLSQFPNLDLVTNPLELYRLATHVGDLEINDPSEVFIARDVQLVAGSTDSPATLTVRADMGAPTGPGGTCQTVCGIATNPNLVLIGSGSAAEAVSLSARRIVLEAPDGYVDAGDERIGFFLQDFGGLLAIRQGDAMSDQTRLPDRFQILDNPDTPGVELESATIELQSLQGITVDAELAMRVAETNLSLVGGIPQDDFDAAATGRRGERPVADPDPELPDHVYDRLADANGDGVVELLPGVEEPILDQDVTIFDAVPTQPFELLLRNLAIRVGDLGRILLGNVHIKTESNQIYRNDVVLRDDTELTAKAGLLALPAATLTPPASSISFEKTIEGMVGGESLTVNATDRILFMEEVGKNNPLGTLTLNLQQLIQFESEPPTPRVEFGTADFVSTGADNLFQVRADNILLNPESGDRSTGFARTRVPDAATFFRRGGSLELEVGAGGASDGKLVMGVNEKLAVDGDVLRIKANDGTVTVGDLSARDLIEVDAGSGTIHIQRRGGGPIVRANGRTLRDPGVDFVARAIDFRFGFDPGDESGSATLYRNQVGSGRAARFGVANPGNAPGFMDEFSVLSLQFNLLTGLGLGFGGTDLALDGAPDGISRVELAQSFAPARRDVRLAVPAAQRVRSPDELASVGIQLRDPTDEEQRLAARGAAIYQDLGSMGRRDGQVSVSEARLVSSEVERTAELYTRLFGSDGSRAPLVRSVLQEAVEDYKRSTGARRVVGFELRRYVYNRPSSQFEAYQELQNLDALFRHHRRSGLTPTEYGTIQRQWLEAVQPEGISVRELGEFVHPSRYVRGSDVLDVFGD